MDKTEALAERARLRSLLDAYDAGRLARHTKGGRTGRTRDVAPDRADNVRVRIARLEQLITELEHDEKA